MPLKTYYPFKPYIVTQKWGVYNPEYSSLGFSNHNGEDANIGPVDYTNKKYSEYPVYCPVEGFRVSEVAYYPKGGGNQIGLTSKEKYLVGDKLCFVSIILCHAKEILVKVGDEPKLGELIMIADNTGFSTGIHTHTGMYRLNDDLSKMDSNNETGSYDPALVQTGLYAVDQGDLETRILSDERYYQYRVKDAGTN